MNKAQLLQMTSKEIENFLNDNISGLNLESVNAATIKDVAIKHLKTLFDDTVKIISRYTTKNEIEIEIGSVAIQFKIGAKNTNNTVSVTKLRKTHIKTLGKIKFSDIRVSCYNPCLDGDNLDEYTIKLSECTSSGGAVVSLKHRKEKIIDMLTKDILMEEIQSQDTNWSDIRKNVLITASQPKLQDSMCKPGFNQAMWDEIIVKTEEVNRELIDSEIEKILTVNI